MIKHGDKFTEFLKKSIVWVCAYVLLYEIKPIRIFLYNILKFMEDNNLLELFRISVLDIKDFYLYTRIPAIIYIFISVFLIFIAMKYYLRFRNYLRKPKNLSLSPLDESLYKYIENKPNGRGYLVTGEWGSGKTYIVNKFFERYYKFSHRRIYRVSCFGLDSRNLILNEIRNQIEINDKSIINWIQYIPGLGKPLHGMLKETYSLKSIPKESIFIFDDFERITSLGIANYSYKNSEKIRKVMRNSTFNSDRGLDNVYKEIQTIATAVNKIRRENEITEITDNLQKYNIVTGLINELIENYKINVIIICNVDILGHDFVDKVFRGKLDSITYNKAVDETSLSNIINSSFDNQIFSIESVKFLVKDILNEIRPDFEKVWSSNANNNNLRQVKSIVQAFVETVNIISTKVSLNKSYLISLFYSIYVISILKDDEKGLEDSLQFYTGGNLGFFLNLYHKESLFESIKYSNYFSKLKWVSVSVAGFWLLNTGKPSDIKSLMSSYNQYEYNDLELTLLKDENFKWQNEKLLVEHLMFIVNKDLSINPSMDKYSMEAINQMVKNNINYILDHTKPEEIQTEEIIKSILLKVDNYLGSRYPNDFLELLYRSIYKYTNVKSVTNEQNNSRIREYNQSIKKEET